MLSFLLVRLIEWLSTLNRLRIFGVARYIFLYFNHDNLSVSYHGFFMH